MYVSLFSTLLGFNILYELVDKIEDNFVSIGIAYDECGKKYQCFLAKYENNNKYVCIRQK